MRLLQLVFVKVIKTALAAGYVYVFSSSVIICEFLSRN